MTWTYPLAEDGNVALLGELVHPEGVIALGLAANLVGARTLARSSLNEGFDAVRRSFVHGWENWGRVLDIPDAPPELERAAYLSASRAAHACRSLVSRRHRRQPQRALGQHQRQHRRLSPGVDARHRGGEPRAARHRPARRCAPHARLSLGHPARRRRLEPELLSRRRAVLGRQAARRGRLPDPSRRQAARAGRAARRARRGRRWCGARRPTSPRTDRSARRTAGRRTRA